MQNDRYLLIHLVFCSLLHSMLIFACHIISLTNSISFSLSHSIYDLCKYHRHNQIALFTIIQQRFGVVVVVVFFVVYASHIKKHACLNIDIMMKVLRFFPFKHEKRSIFKQHRIIFQMLRGSTQLQTKKYFFRSQKYTLCCCKRNCNRNVRDYFRSHSSSYIFI